MPENQDENLTIYKRRLPHWRLSGAVYFITWRLCPTQPELMHDERSVVASALKHFDGSRYELFAYVVMHNHVHVLIEAKDKYPLQDIVIHGNLTLQIAHSVHSADRIASGKMNILTALSGMNENSCKKRNISSIIPGKPGRR